MKRFCFCFFVFGFLTLPVFAQEARVSAPKKVIAVADFVNKANPVGQMDIGKAMSEMLTDALIQSNQFIVLERQKLKGVMAEQNLAASSRAAKVGGAKQGDIKRAQILVEGVISEYMVGEEGGSQGFNIKGFNIGAGSDNAHIAVIVRLIDTTTSQVIASQRVEGKANKGGMNISFTESKWGFSQSGKKAMPIDKAVQIAIDNAVNYIAEQMRNVAWTGKVIMAKEDGTVFINAGSESNISRDSIFMVYRPGEVLIDPDTGLNLGSDEQFLGRLQIKSVQPKFSKGEMKDAKMAAKGDIVRFVG